MDTADPPAVRTTPVIGLYLAVVQFFLVIGWVVYAAYLPQLAKAAGLQATWVPWLLMADQLVFIVSDLAVGLASDRAARFLGRVGRAMVVATLLSCAAFLALPWVAAQGSPAALIAVTFFWAVTSSALRAPPLALLGRYAARPQQPLLIALSSLGLGLAGAVAPYVALQLKGMPPTVPFLMSAACLALVTLGMVAAERSLAGGAQKGSLPLTRHAVPAAQVAALLVAAALGAAAFQWHGSVASGPLALRYTTPANLSWVLPLFWVGFNLALWPVGAVTRRVGPWRAMALGALLAAGGSLAAALAGGLPPLLAAQAVAGAGWALLLCSALSGALALGQRTNPGLLSGALNAVLAGAALARIAVVSQVAPQAPVVVSLAWLAAAGFCACALVSLWSSRRGTDG